MNPFKYIANFFKSFSDKRVFISDEDSGYKDTFFSRLAFRFTHGTRPVFSHIIENEDVGEEIENRHRIADWDDVEVPEDEPESESKDEPEKRAAEPVSAKLPWYKRLWRAISGPSREEAQAEIDEAQEDLKTFEFDGQYQPSAKPAVSETPDDVVSLSTKDIDRFNNERRIIEGRLNRLREKGKCTEDFANEVTALLDENPYRMDSERTFMAIIPEENFNDIARNYVTPKDTGNNKEISLREMITNAKSIYEKSKNPTLHKDNQLNASASRNAQSAPQSLIN